MFFRRLLLGAAIILSPGLQAKVDLDGLNRAQTDNVRAFLSLQELDDNARQDKVYRRYRAAGHEISQALQALGYYSPQIKHSLDFPEQAPWVARFDIDAGPRSYIRQQKIEYQGPGADLLQEQVKLDDLSGQPLHHDAYRKLKQAILNQSFDLGFVQAQISQSELLVDPAKASADIQMTIDSGPRFYFGNINIEQDILADAFIQRYVDIKQGTPFNADALLTLQLRLSDLNYFSNLNVSTQTREEDQRLDINIVATPKKPQRYQFGLGYGTDTGPRASLTTEFRHLNQQGHRLRSDLRMAEKQQSWSARYLIPTGSRVGSNLALSVAFTAEEFADARTDNWTWQLSRSQVHGPRLWQGYLRYELEKFSIGDNTRDQTELLMPGLNINLRRADNELNPRQGYKLFADVHVAHQDLVSSASFVQVLLQGRLILPLPGRSRLLLRGESGGNFVSEVSELPLSQRFFAGGDKSVRGYAYQSLGTRNEDGDVIGGKYLNVASIEIDKLLYRDYGIAAFYDYGGASDKPGQKLYAGAGIGLRWRTPIGMLRADFAWPLDKSENGMRVHIGIGAEL